MPGRQTFPRKERFTQRREFLAVYKQGEKLVGQAFVCYVTRREGQGRKIGFAVPRAVGSAVVRNRVKRYLREIYRTHRTQLAEDVHVVAVARPPSAKMTYRQCEEAIRQLFRKGAMLSG